MTILFAWRYRSSNKDATYAPEWAHSHKIEAIVWGVPCVIIIVLDAVVSKSTNGKIKLPPLAVGIGFYLPAAVTTMLVIGAVVGWVYDKAVKTTRFADVARRMGVLLASGLIVGESLFGVFYASVIVGTNSEAPFAMIPEGSGWPAMLAGIVVFAAAVFGLYSWTRKRAEKV